LIVALEELHRHATELAELAGVRVDVEHEGTQAFVILRDLPLPPGAYNLANSDILFTTDAQYPLSAMDMFWADVALVRADGSIPQNAQVIETYLGRQWRRFSWHRNGVWNPNGNPLLDHFEFMQSRFDQDAPA
jgi:hypothetical protein